MTRALIIDDAARAEVARVIAYAEAHHYRPGQPIPGDNSNFVAVLSNGFRTVFSFTEASGMLWRHLSVSVPGEKYPNPHAAFAIAELFGFTGWDGLTTTAVPLGWTINVNQAEHCIVLGQPIATIEKMTN